MSSEWRSYSLEQIALKGKEGMVDGPFGSNLPERLYTQSGVPVIRGSNLTKGKARFRDHEFVYVSDETAQKLSRSLCFPGDIVFTKKGTLGQIGFVPAGKHPRYLISSNQMRMRVDPVVADAEFVYYYLAQQKSIEKVIRDSEHTGVPKINLAYLRGFPICLPPLDYQKEVTATLRAIDDRVALLRETNATLEAIAQALFKSWFVDFDPVHAKQQGRAPEGMDEATAGLFPDSFEESELGLVPKGWSFDTIKNRASSIQYGFTQSASAHPIGPQFLRITDIRGGAVEWSSVPFCEASDTELDRYRISHGDVLVARTGASTGESVYIIEPPVAVFASYLVRFQFKSHGVGRLVGAFMRTSEYTNHVAGIIGGSAQPNANAQALAAASIVFPTEQIAASFYEIVRPLDLRRAANDLEAQTLATLRETLLPRLISGQLRLPEASSLS